MQDLPCPADPKAGSGTSVLSTLSFSPGSPSLGALKFIMGVWEPQGWERTSHEMEEWDVRAWHGTGWVGGAAGGINNLKSQFERPVLPGQEAQPKKRGSHCWERSCGAAAA